MNAKAPEGAGDSHWRRNVLIALLIGAAAAGIIAALTTNQTAGTLGPEPIATTQTTFSVRSCTTGPARSTLRLTLYGAEGGACAGLAQEEAASTSERWHSWPRERGKPVCSMSNGVHLIEVRGEKLGADRVCGNLLAKGWHDIPGPGEKIEAEEEAYEQEQKATARLHEVEAREREAAKRHAQPETHK